MASDPKRKATDDLRRFGFTWRTWRAIDTDPAYARVVRVLPCWQHRDGDCAWVWPHVMGVN